MNVITVYYLAVLTSFIAGVYLIYDAFVIQKGAMQIRYRAGPVYRFKKIKSAVMDTGQDQIFVKAGLKLTMRKYRALRKICFLTCILIGIAALLQNKYFGAEISISTGIIFYTISYPSREFRGKNTIFSKVLLRLQSKRANAMDEELTGIILQMKNIIISNNQDMSANYIFARLLPFTKITEPVFSTSLMYIRQGELQKSGNVFEEMFNTKIGSSFSQIIMKLDELPPKEFLEQLDLVQKKAIAEHRTRKEDRKVRVNTLRRLFAILEAVLIMGNFVYLILIDTLLLMNF